MYEEKNSIYITRYIMILLPEYIVYIVINIRIAESFEYLIVVKLKRCLYKTKM